VMRTAPAYIDQAMKLSAAHMPSSPLSFTCTAHSRNTKERPSSLLAHWAHTLSYNTVHTNNYCIAASA
jgi:hypothetical protein